MLFSLQSIRDFVRADFNQSDIGSFLQEADIDRWVNEGYMKYAHSLMMTDEGFFEQTFPLDIVANQEQIPLPTVLDGRGKHMKTILLEKCLPTSRVPLTFHRRYNEANSINGGIAGWSYLPRWKFRGNNIVLEPTPTFSETAKQTIIANGNMESWTAHSVEYQSNGNFETWTGLTDVLVDGALEVWTNPTTLTNWTLGGAGATLSREATIIKKGTYSAKIVAAATSGYIQQNSASPTSYRNKSFVSGAWVYCTTLNGAYIDFYDDVSGHINSSMHQGTGWEYLSIARSFLGTTSQVILLLFASAGCTVYFDDAKTYEMLPPTSWTLTGTGGVVSREEGTIHGGTYSSKITRNGTDIILSQDIQNSGGHNLAYWKGRTITIGMWVWASVANRAYVIFNDGIQNIQSTAHPGDSTWHYLTVTGTVSSTATIVDAVCEVLTGDTTAYFDDAIVTSNTYDQIAPNSWTQGGVGAVVSADTTIVRPGSTYSAKIVSVGDAYIIQAFSPIPYLGRKLSYGVWCYCLTANVARINIVVDGVDASYSSWHTGAGWEYISCSKTIDPSATSAYVALAVNGGAGTAYFDDATLYDSQNATAGLLLTAQVMPARLHMGTASAGSAYTITLDSAADPRDAYYNGTRVYIISGTGYGQIRTISEYNGSTKVATVDSVWVTNPDSTSVFSTLIHEDFPEDFHEMLPLYAIKCALGKERSHVSEQAHSVLRLKELENQLKDFCEDRSTARKFVQPWTIEL